MRIVLWPLLLLSVSKSSSFVDASGNVGCLFSEELCRTESQWCYDEPQKMVKVHSSKISSSCGKMSSCKRTLTPCQEPSRKMTMEEPPLKVQKVHISELGKMSSCRLYPTPTSTRERICSEESSSEDSETDDVEAAICLRKRYCSSVYYFTLILFTLILGILGVMIIGAEIYVLAIGGEA